MKKIGLLIIISLLSINVVNAAKVSDLDYYDREEEKYKLTADGFSAESSTLENDYLKPGSRILTKYDAYLKDKNIGAFFCISPSKPHGATYTIKSQIDIDSTSKSQKKAFYAALLKAYQEFISRGFIKTSTKNYGDRTRQLITLVYRWIASYYGYLDTDYARGGVSEDNYVIYTYSKRKSWGSKNWKDDNGDGLATVARDILANAIRVGNKVKNGKTIRELANKGELWDINFNVTATVLDNTDKSKVKIQLDIVPKGATKGTDINYDDFKVECDYDFECSKFKMTGDIKVNGKKGKRFTLTVNTKNGRTSAAEKAGKPYGITIKTNYNDIRDGAFLYEMTPASKYVQEMLLILYFRPDFEIISTETPSWEDKCYCQRNSKGKLTGRYEYKKYTESKVITGTIDLLDTEKAEKYECPPPEDCGVKTVCQCDYDENNVFTNQYAVTYKSEKDTKVEKFSATDTEKSEKYACPPADSCVKTTCSCQFDDNVYTGNYVVEQTENGETTEIIVSANDVKASEYGCPPVTYCSECSCETDTKGNFTGNYLYYKNGNLFEKFKLDDATKATKYSCPPATDCANDCFCQVDENNEYTEKYQYNGFEDGRLVTEVFDFDDPRAENYNCPSSKTCHPQRKECTYEDDGTYYGKNGVEVTKDEYIAQCVTSCKTEPTGDGNTKYYCNSDSELISGPECSKEEYEEDCICTPMKEKCDNGDTASCEEYQDKCLPIPSDCSAKVTIPDECANFDADTMLEAEIDDVNLDPGCGKDNSIKKCVVNGTDQAGNSYLHFKNNYCTVWCKEKYNFTLPTARHTRSGGYFTLSAKITGERTCYATGSDDTTTPIDEPRFHRDLEDAEAALQLAYENYISAKNNKENSERTLENLNNQTTSIENAVSYAQSELTIAQSLYSSARSALSSAESELSSAESELSSAQSALNSIPEGDEAARTSALANVSRASIRVSNAQTAVHIAQADISSAASRAQSAQNSLSDAITARDNHYISITNTERNIELAKQEMAKNEASMNDLNSKIQTFFNEYNSCASWEVEFKFDPKIDYWYNEKYMDILTTGNSGTFEADGTTSLDSTEEYCSGIADENFECENGQTSQVKYKDQNYVYCTIEGCVTKSSRLNDVKWIRKNEKSSNSYRPHANFSTSTGFGTIKRNDIGQYASGSLGRLLGASQSVVTSLSRADSMCSTPGYKATTSTSYVCEYINDCSECEADCINCGSTPYDPGDPYDPPNIPETECKGQTCPLTCSSCIYDGGKTQFSFRTVSVNNVFPNSCNKALSNCRKEGYNWDTNNPKAKKTLEEIEEKGESAYQEPEYSYTLNPGQLQNIRKYNDKAGTYLNTTIPDSGDTALKCERLDINGKLYNVKCTSSFLDQNSQTYFSEQKRNTTFTLWDTNNVNDLIGIGPSWK